VVIGDYEHLCETSHCVRCFSRLLPTNGVQGTVGGGGARRPGKNIGEPALFWVTNKRANVTPREACGSVGCRVSWPMRERDWCFTTENLSE